MTERVYPEISFITVGEMRIAYRQAGKGPPLVLLHGGLEDSRSWRMQLQALASDFTVIAWDAPGCGGSDDPPDTWRMPDYAACLAGFIKSLGLKRPAILGLSWGSGLAIQLFALDPRAMSALVLASAYSGWAGSLPPEEVKRRLQQALHEVEEPSESSAESWIPTLFTATAPQEAIDETVEIMNDSRSAGMRTMLLSFAECDLRSVLPTIDVPTLLLYGAEDVRSPVSVGQSMHEVIPKSELIVIPEVGHMVSVQTPNRFNDEVRSFLLSNVG